MPVPMPKTEVHVDVIANRVINIYTASSDAANWILNHAPTFGKLFNERPGEFSLILNPNYDVEEVAAYIRALGQEEEKEQP